MTDSKQKNNYNYLREANLLSIDRLPDKNNNYNYVRGQFTTF